MAIKRNLTLSLSPEQADQVEKFMFAHGIPKPQDALRVLIDQSLAATPIDGAQRAEIHRAYREVREWAWNRVNAAFQEIYNELKAAQAADKGGR